MFRGCTWAESKSCLWLLRIILTDSCVSSIQWMINVSSVLNCDQRCFNTVYFVDDSKHFQISLYGVARYSWAGCWPNVLRAFIRIMWFPVDFPRLGVPLVFSCCPGFSLGFPWCSFGFLWCPLGFPTFSMGVFPIGLQGAEGSIVGSAHLPRTRISHTGCSLLHPFFEWENIE